MKSFFMHVFCHKRCILSRIREKDKCYVHYNLIGELRSRMKVKWSKHIWWNLSEWGMHALV